MSKDDYYFKIFETNNDAAIISEDNQGNYTSLTPTGLEYYDSVYGNKIKYNKKIAFGVAENNEYVDLSSYSFKNTPSILVTPKNIPLFSHENNSQSQSISVGYKEASSQGFRVYAGLDLNSYENAYDYNYQLPIWRSDAGGSTTITRKRGFYNTSKYRKRTIYTCNLDLNKVEAFTLRAEVYEYDIETGQDISFVKKIYDVNKTVGYNHNEQVTLDTGILPIGIYIVRITFKILTLTTDVISYFNITSLHQYYREVKKELTGEANWVATE